MQIPFMLLQVIVVPIVFAAIVGLFGKRLGKRLGWIVFGVLLYTSLLLVFAGFNIFNNGGQVFEKYNWSNAIPNLNFGFQADGLSLPVALVMNLVCTACAVYSIRYMQHRIEELYGKEATGMYRVYYSIYLLFSVGLTGVALSTNLIEMYLFVELALIPSYIMIDLFGYVDRHRIAMMYFIWNHIGAALFLIGVVSAYAGTGSFEITALATISGTSLGFWVCLLMLVGWLVKMATFGFHVWLPYAHGEHPTSIAAIIATIVGLGNYVFARLLFGNMLTTFKLFQIPLSILAVVTIIYGAFLTMGQDDVKRLYACSTISQTAYSILGIASMTTIGVVGGVYYFISHMLGKCILFSVAGIMLSQTGTRSISKMGGLARKMPLTATVCILGSMILSAIPPLSGFQAEWMLFTGVFQQGNQANALGLVFAVIAILATFLTVVYTFWPAVRMFFGELPESMKDVKEAPISMVAPLFALAVISLLIGIFPELITRFLNAVIV